jgi:hypothetical protein
MRLALIVGVVTWAALSVPPALAEHLTLTPQARSSTDVHVDLEVDADGFRLEARLLGEKGVYGAGLTGRVRPDGLTLDGWAQDGDRTVTFTVDTDTLRARARAIVRRWVLGE